MLMWLIKISDEHGDFFITIFSIHFITYITFISLHEKKIKFAVDLVLFYLFLFNYCCLCPFFYNVYSHDMLHCCMNRCCRPSQVLRWIIKLLLTLYEFCNCHQQRNHHNEAHQWQNYFNIANLWLHNKLSVAAICADWLLAISQCLFIKDLFRLFFIEITFRHHVFNFIKLSPNFT